MGILAKLSKAASDIPGMLITIGSGLAGCAMPGPSGSVFGSLLKGDFEAAFDAVAYNYAGIHTKSNSNTFGNMLMRAKGTWAAVFGKLVKTYVVVDENSGIIETDSPDLLHVNLRLLLGLVKFLTSPSGTSIGNKQIREITDNICLIVFRSLDNLTDTVLDKLLDPRLGAVEGEHVSVIGGNNFNATAITNVSNEVRITKKGGRQSGHVMGHSSLVDETISKSLPESMRALNKAYRM